MDFANLCGLAGLLGRDPVGIDIAPQHADSLLALLRQTLPRDTVLSAMKLPPFVAVKGATAEPDQPPQATVRVQPMYPDSLRKAGVEGTVKVRALVSAAGDVQAAHVIDGVPGLDVAAVAAVRMWKFRPATHGGTPVASWVVVPVMFTLQPAAGEPKH